MKLSEALEKHGDIDVEELKEKLGIKEESKVWKPKVGDKFYCIDWAGYIVETKWSDYDCDNNAYAIGNCFKTHKEAEFALEKLKVIAELKRFAEEHNEGKINWNDEQQEKWGINLELNTHGLYKCKINFFSTYFYKRKDIYFISTEIARQAIEAIGEDRLKKYYFEVEE